MRLLHFAAAPCWRLDVLASISWATAVAGFGPGSSQFPMAAGASCLPTLLVSQSLVVQVALPTVTVISTPGGGPSR